MSSNLHIPYSQFPLAHSQSYLHGNTSYDVLGQSQEELQDSVRKLFEEKNYDLTDVGYYKEINKELLCEKVRKTLIEKLDELHDETHKDYILELSLQEFKLLIDKTTFDGIKDVFEDELSDTVKLCKVITVENDTTCIPLHLDFAEKTMCIHLNNQDCFDISEETRYVGGVLCYVNTLGETYIPKRPAGYGLIHNNRIAHTVSPMVFGTRYSLFFFKK